MAVADDGRGVMESAVCVGAYLAALLQAHDRVDRQFGIDVRKEVAAACRFPADRVAEADEIHPGAHQAGLTGEISGDRSLELPGGRKADIAVGEINRCPAAPASGL